jgi:putative endonuclease
VKNRKQYLWKESDLYSCIEQAIERETQLKKWSRRKKDLLITSINPEWDDLWDKIQKMVY